MTPHLRISSALWREILSCANQGEVTEAALRYLGNQTQPMSIMSSPCLSSIWNRLRPRCRFSAAFGTRSVFICAAKTRLEKRIKKAGSRGEQAQTAPLKMDFLMFSGQ